MNPEEQTVTWLISLGVLNSPKKNIADPEEFLKTSLKDGVVLCKLMERLVPGTVPKVSRTLLLQCYPCNILTVITEKSNIYKVNNLNRETKTLATPVEGLFESQGRGCLNKLPIPAGVM